jgi:hypothetical protein
MVALVFPFVLSLSKDAWGDPALAAVYVDIV